MGVSAAATAAQMAVYIVCGFVIGFMGVWFYASIRPSYGPGVCTAVIADHRALWIPAYVLSMAPSAMMGIIPMRLMAIAVAVGLIELLVATVAGAWLFSKHA